MTINRRSLLSKIELGARVIPAALLKACSGSKEESKLAYIKAAASRNQSMNFNMCGYAAPKLKKVRVGFVGIGDRGSGAVTRMTCIESPDFTRGAWKTNKPIDLTLNGGGATAVRNLTKADSKGQLNVH